VTAVEIDDGFAVWHAANCGNVVGGQCSWESDEHALWMAGCLAAKSSEASRGAVLSDGSIREWVRYGALGIDPFNPAHVQPASYDLTLAADGPLELLPGVFHLLSSVETVQLPKDLQGQVHGRSSLGRKGVLVHFTAGFIDPGFCGQITFEVMTLAGAVSLMPGDRIAQIAFTLLDLPCQHPYQGRYQNQAGPTPSRFEHGDA
jgi:dCTP deaminase